MSNNSVPVSVILPSYNHEKHLGQAVESVLYQDYSDFELLISDDGSSDNSVKVIESYTDPRIKANYFKTNRGAYFNHKHLIDKANGEYIALINSDDLWLPGKLKKQMDFMRNNPSYGACFTWAYLIDENNDKVSEPNVFIQPNRSQSEWIEYFYTRGNCICHPSILIKREIYERLGSYNGAMRQLPDFDMWVRLIKHYPIYVIQEFLTCHRRFITTGENTSAPSLNNSMRDVLESYCILNTFFNDMPDELIRQAFNKHFRNTEATSNLELACEKFFLMLDKKYYIGGVNLLSAVNYFIKTYNYEGMADTYKECYNFTLQDFYKITGQIDLLGMLPQGTLSDADSPNFIPYKYVKENKIRVISMIFLERESKAYKGLKSIYNYIFNAR